MSREFKFRVYVKELRKFVYFELGEFLHPERYLNQDGIDVQQFTGLKDAKGNTIYEGDVLQFFDEDKGNEPCEVVYELGMFGCNIIDTSNNKDFWQLYYIVTKLKPIVIGNILEHSELLK